MKKQMTCGIIMPISQTQGYPQHHWNDVLQIFKGALEDSEFEAKLVSEAPEIGLIHQRIVSNIFQNEVLICDISAKNPNVMFELGMRLAFDKATIIVKDDLTDYSFDTAVIEHLEYPSTLRYEEIVKFKLELKEKVQATFIKSKEKDFSPFLKAFVKNVTRKNFDPADVSELDIILDEIKQLRREVDKSSQLHDSRFWSVVAPNVGPSRVFPPGTKFVGTIDEEGRVAKIAGKAIIVPKEEANEQTNSMYK